VTAQTVRQLSSHCPGLDFDQFYRQMQPRLLAFARVTFGGRDADEITSETMARALENFSELDQSRPLLPWLVTVARNVARDMYRNRTFCEPVTDDAFACVPDRTTGVDEQVATLEQVGIIEKAMRQLNERDHRIMRMRLIDEMSHEHIAALFGTNVITVRQQFHRARARFLSSFSTLGGDLRGLLPIPLLVALARRLRQTATQTATTATRVLQVAGAATVLAAGPVGMALFPATSGPSTSLSDAMVASAEKSSIADVLHAPVLHARAVRTTHAAKPVNGAARPPAVIVAAAGPADAAVHVAPNPLAAGRSEEHRIAVVTPFGTLFVEGTGDNSGSRRVVCVVGAVHCD
jgi:RNA polymerase sigma-70 factor (ECF subfamily)